MNRVFEVGEGTLFLTLRATTLVITVIILLLVVALAGMLLLNGPVAVSLGNVIGLGGAF